MGLFDFLKPKGKRLKPLSVKRTSLEERIKHASQKTYKAKVAIVYEGKPLRQFETTVKAHSRGHAAHKIEENLDLKLLSVSRKRRTG